MKKIILILFLATAFSGCDSQIGSGIQAAIGNLFTGNMFSHSASDEAYQKMKDTIIKDEGVSLETQKSCEKTKVEPIIPNKDKKDLSSIKNLLCTCAAWGTCDKQSCSCDTLCPKGFDILTMNKNVLDDSASNSLAFANGDFSFYKKYSNYRGFCWGHAVVTQRFNRLASFKPNENKKFMGSGNDQSRIREYKSIIKKLNNNEPVDIPGFNNLHDFSSDPEVKEILQDTLKDVWAQNAMSSQGLSIVASGEPQGAKHYNDLFDDIEFRLKHHQSPTIIFNQQKSSSYAHSVLVNGYGKTSDGRRYICLRDNNYYPEQNQHCGSQMILENDGTVSYGPWEPAKIGKVELSYTENSNTLEQMKNLSTKCENEKNCPSKTKL